MSNLTEAIHSADDAGPDTSERFHFPRWANYMFPALLIIAIGILTYIPFVGTLAISPATRSVGYQPEQPMPFSHAVHAGTLKIDCRYCHSTVETAAFAAVPATQICLNCHASIKSDSPKLALVRKSFESGQPISWKKVHSVPDFVYFNHSAHFNKGIACESCHGRIDQMEEVYQAQSLSMAWCIECHRAPENHIRPREFITSMGWDSLESTGKGQLALGRELIDAHNVQSMQFMTSCSTCHR
jgi:menaquinone reductase, multiheme cytochrome c subunit